MQGALHSTVALKRFPGDLATEESHVKPEINFTDKYLSSDDRSIHLPTAFRHFLYPCPQDRCLPSRSPHNTPVSVLIQSNLQLQILKIP